MLRDVPAMAEGILNLPLAVAPKRVLQWMQISLSCFSMFELMSNLESFLILVGFLFEDSLWDKTSRREVEEESVGESDESETA